MALTPAHTSGRKQRPHFSVSRQIIAPSAAQQQNVPSVVRQPHVPAAQLPSALMVRPEMPRPLLQPTQQLLTLRVPRASLKLPFVAKPSVQQVLPLKLPLVAQPELPQQQSAAQQSVLTSQT